MMYPYAEFLLDFERKHGGLQYENAPENKRAAVIVETRPLFFLPKVIKNAMYFLGPGWNLHVLTSDRARDFVVGALPGWKVQIASFSAGARMSDAEYNGLLTTPAFWNRFAEDIILVFQTDCVFAGPNVDAFQQYDFVGAPCGPLDENFVINGGLSLRSRRMMVDCTTRFTCTPGVPEDVFFTALLRNMGAFLPDFQTAAAFALESTYLRHPVGVHGTDKCYHSIEIAKKVTEGIRY